jgi:hypothetical protein
MDTLMSVHIVLDCKLPWLDACGCSVDVIMGPFKLIVVEAWHTFDFWCVERWVS